MTKGIIYVMTTAVPGLIKIGKTDPKTPYVGIGIWWLKDQIQGMTED